MNLKGPRSREDPELNLISLIDVVLLLLIFFMVSTTFVDEARIRIQLPEAGAAPATHNKNEAIEIAVTAEGGYMINGKALINASPQTISAAVSEIAKERRNIPVTIRADGRAMHQAVVTAMDVIARMGFKTISIATVNAAANPGAGKR